MPEQRCWLQWAHVWSELIMNGMIKAIFSFPNYRMKINPLKREKIVLASLWQLFHSNLLYWLTIVLWNWTLFYPLVSKCNVQKRYGPLTLYDIVMSQHESWLNISCKSISHAFPCNEGPQGLFSRTDWIWTSQTLDNSIMLCHVCSYIFPQDFKGAPGSGGGMQNLRVD